MPLTKLKEWVREWAAVGTFLAVITISSLFIVYATVRSSHEAAVQRDRIATSNEAALKAIVSNGEFQTCVWTSIVKPRVVGHQHRSIRAINHCADKYLEGVEK